MKEATLVNTLKEYDNIIIYGAGMVGGLVYERLKTQSLLEQLVGFAISKKAQEQTYNGVPVYEIGELVSYRTSACVIIATLPELQDEIAETLSEHQFTNVICVDKKLYSDMGKNYIRNFVVSHPIQQDKIDVLFMASDNNCTSGAFLCMADLNAELNSHGISTLVVLPQYGNGEYILSDRGIEYTYVASEHWAFLCKKPEWEEKLAALSDNECAINEIEKLIENYQVRLVHNNTTYTYVGAVAAHRKRIPVVWHLRENIKAQGFAFVQPEYAIQTINQSDKVLVVSEYLRSCLDKLDFNRVQIVYDGVDIEKYYLRRTILNHEKSFTIVLVGAVMPLKGQEELLRAASILVEKGLMDFRILFVGGGEKDYISELERLTAAMYLTEHIQFLGRQNNIQEFYEKADIAVVCSRSEAFGRATVEAQLAGCVVIGADIGATSELILDNKTGILYQQGSSEELAEKIIYAVKNPEISRKIALEGQEYACASFSKERNAEEVMQIYKSIFSRQR